MNTDFQAISEDLGHEKAQGISQDRKLTGSQTSLNTRLEKSSVPDQGSQHKP